MEHKSLATQKFINLYRLYQQVEEDLKLAQFQYNNAKNQLLKTEQQLKDIMYLLEKLDANQ